GIQGILGETYLEKIVQVPFELPQPSPDVLFHMLLKELEKVLGEIPRELYGTELFAILGPEGYLPLIKSFLKTPRDVVRLVNTLNVTFPIVKNEVNVSDFVAIEAIRVFFPEVYTKIRQNRRVFSGYAISGDDPLIFDNTNKIYKYNRQLEALLKKLFPKFESNLDTSYE